VGLVTRKTRAVKRRGIELVAMGECNPKKVLENGKGIKRDS
jgi:hypothetical protein